MVEATACLKALDLADQYDISHIEFGDRFNAIGGSHQLVPEISTLAE
jgi:hypothetical protein